MFLTKSGITLPAWLFARGTEMMPMSRRLKHVLLTLFVALALSLGYASWRGWLPGLPDYSQTERDFR